MAAVSYAYQTDARLTVDVVEGQNAINNVTRTTGFEPVVEVKDTSGRPVEGAAVTFTLPALGPGGTFADGGKTLMIHTDAAGRAAAKGLRPNKATGRFEIHVRASHAGDSASTVITQTNAAPTSVSSGSGKKWAIVLGVLGGAVAAGAVAAGGGGSSAARPPSTAADSPSGSVTPGAPGFGPPR
jgi:hypothetical protein